MTPLPQHLPARTSRLPSSLVTPAPAPPAPPAPPARPEAGSAAGDPAVSSGARTWAQLTATGQAVAQSPALRARLDVTAVSGDDVQGAVVGQGGW